MMAVDLIDHFAIAHLKDMFLFLIFAPTSNEMTTSSLLLYFDTTTRHLGTFGKFYFFSGTNQPIYLPLLIVFLPDFVYLNNCLSL